MTWSWPYWFGALFLGFLSVATCRAQERPGPGGDASETSGRYQEGDTNDTLYLFMPVRSLIDSLSSEHGMSQVVGFDILFSSSGLGVGGFLQHNFSNVLSGFANVSITGTRNADEFPDYNGNVPNKVNRLFTLPLLVGLRRRLFDQAITSDFRPYVNVGVGPVILAALPYDYELLPSIRHAYLYVTGGGFVGVGAESASGQPIIGFNARYFVVPFQSGLESIRENRITDFGGLFLTMNVGFIP